MICLPETHRPRRDTLKPATQAGFFVPVLKYSNYHLTAITAKRGDKNCCTNSRICDILAIVPLAHIRDIQLNGVLKRMFISKPLGTNWDLHLCRWGKGTFFTPYHFYASRELVICRLFRVELELSKHPKNNNDTEVQENASF